MGGDKNRKEQPTFDKWKKNKEVWQEIEDRGMVPFLERLHGPSPLLTEMFVNDWNKGVLMAYGAEFQVDETLVATVMGLAMNDKKIYRDRKTGEEDMVNFFDKDKERLRVNKMADGGYNRKELMTPWANMTEFIMRYITLDGRYANIFFYHFTILNHFRHGKVILIPFYLVSSLEIILEKHVENPNNPVLHEGLIVPIKLCTKAH